MELPRISTLDLRQCVGEDIEWHWPRFPAEKIEAILAGGNHSLAVNRKRQRIVTYTFNADMVEMGRAFRRATQMAAQIAQGHYHVLSAKRRRIRPMRLWHWPRILITLACVLAFSQIIALLVWSYPWH